MSNIQPPVVRLSDSDAETAARLAHHFAQYGQPATLHPADANLLSMLGEFAVSLWALGSIEPVLEHRMGSLRGAVTSGIVADGGRDLPEHRLDVKSTLDRHERGWRSLNLYVKPHQVRSDHAYVLAVPVEPPTGRLEDVREVLLAGWTDSCGLRENDERHRGWSSCAACLLWPMKDLRLEDWAVQSSSIESNAPSGQQPSSSRTARMTASTP